MVFLIYLLWIISTCQLSHSKSPFTHSSKTYYVSCFLFNLSVVTALGLSNIMGYIVKWVGVRFFFVVVMLILVGDMDQSQWLKPLISHWKLSSIMYKFNSSFLYLLLKAARNTTVFWYYLWGFSFRATALNSTWPPFP